MLEDVLDRVLAKPDMLPHVGALLPTLISGLVTALETTSPDGPFSTSPAKRQASGRLAGTSYSGPQQSSAATGNGRPDLLIQLINKLILQVGRSRSLLAGYNALRLACGAKS